MPITEVVFPLFKLDPESLAALKAATPTLFASVKDVGGLLTLVRGPLLEENGQAVDPNTHRSVLSLGKPKFVVDLLLLIMMLTLYN